MKDQRSGSRRATLKDLANYLGLTKGTVSTVLNDLPSTIPQHTKDRIREAARELNYRPNAFAQALRKKRTYTVGIIAEEIGDPYGGMVINGAEGILSRNKYLFFTVAHRHDRQVLERYAEMLVARGVEGIITVDTSLTERLVVPAVSIAGHKRVEGVTNIILDHLRAAELALQYLCSLGHREIAFIRGHPSSSDSDERWLAIEGVAAEMGVHINAKLTLQLDRDEPSPMSGYEGTKRLLERDRPFTALFAYNDIAAIGAIRFIIEAGMRVPEDISVIGFDDIREAAYQVPSLTTIRQPLHEMGEMAAQALLDRIEGRKEYPPEIAVEPKLVIRESTAHVRKTPLKL